MPLNSNKISINFKKIWICSELKSLIKLGNYLNGIKIFKFLGKTLVLSGVR